MTGDQGVGGEATVPTASYRLGRAAHHAGHGLEACPHPPDHPDHSDWRRGLMAGAAEWAPAYAHSWPEDIGL